MKVYSVKEEKYVKKIERTFCLGKELQKEMLILLELMEILRHR